MKKIGTVNFYLHNVCVSYNQNLCFYKKIHFLLNYYKYQNCNLDIYLGYSQVFFRILSDFFAISFFCYKLIIFEKYEKSINNFYCKSK